MFEQRVPSFVSAAEVESVKSSSHSPVREAAERLASSTDRLHRVIGSLEERLAGVLGVPSIPVDESALAPQTGSSDLVNALAEVHARCEAAAYRIEVLLSRVEL